jgi:acyl-CoA synthetase (NDP forming)
VVVKVVSPDILHKTEYGGVALNLGSANAVRHAVEQMAATIPGLLPQARIEGYLVSEMVKDGVECIVGTHVDEAFGPVITFGLGGTAVELIKDTVCALAPLSVAQAQSLIRGIKTFPLLDGYRGAPKYDVDALALAVSNLSLLAASHAGQIASIEVNPLKVLPAGNGVVALDAVVQTTAMQVS